jgi:MFS family permease
MVYSIRRVNPEQRGTAIGGFAMFQDIAYAFSAPIAGVFADKFGYSSTFLFGFIAGVVGIIIAGSMSIKNLPIINTEN